MRCPICAALNQKHSLECEVEATATLKQRADLAARHTGDPLHQNRFDEEILGSRKRQAHIAFELHRHRTSQHPIPVIGKAVSA